jgi:hypothetical protein
MRMAKAHAQRIFHAVALATRYSDSLFWLQSASMVFVSDRREDSGLVAIDIARELGELISASFAMC